MAKIKVEVEVPDGKYCDSIDAVCPMCFDGEWGTFRCALFNGELEIDDNYPRIIRCEECKQAEEKEQ